MIRNKWCSADTYNGSPIFDLMIVSTCFKSVIPTHSKMLSRIVIKTETLIEGFFNAHQIKFKSEQRS